MSILKSVSILFYLIFILACNQNRDIIENSILYKTIEQSNTELFLKAKSTIGLFCEKMKDEPDFNKNFKNGLKIDSLVQHFNSIVNLYMSKNDISKSELELIKHHYDLVLKQFKEIDSVNAFLNPIKKSENMGQQITDMKIIALILKNNIIISEIKTLEKIYLQNQSCGWPKPMWAICEETQINNGEYIFDVKLIAEQQNRTNKKIEISSILFNNKIIENHQGKIDIKNENIYMKTLKKGKYTINGILIIEQNKKAYPFTHHFTNY